MIVSDPNVVFSAFTWSPLPPRFLLPFPPHPVPVLRRCIDRREACGRKGAAAAEPQRVGRLVGRVVASARNAAALSLPSPLDRVSARGLAATAAPRLRGVGGGWRFLFCGSRDSNFYDPFISVRGGRFLMVFRFAFPRTASRSQHARLPLSLPAPCSLVPSLGL